MTEHGTIAEYATIDRLTPDETLESATDERGNVRALVRITPGWKPAGSCARWSDERYASRITFRDGTIGGRAFLTFAEAEAEYRRRVAENA